MTPRTPAVSLRALVLAAAIPILFLHVRYQPGFGVAVGSTTVDAYLSDFAVLAVVLTGLVCGAQDGFAPLRRGRALWLAAAAFFVWVLFEVAYGRLHEPSYRWQTHGVTAAKFLEYALLAPAVVLIVRTAADLIVVLWSLALWSATATIVAVAQFFGAAIFFTGAAGHRQASFVSFADFAALSGGALLAGIVALVVPEARLGRRLGLVATAAGGLGVILAAAIASILGLATALVVLTAVLVLRRQLAARSVAVAAGVALVVAAGAIAIRASDLETFARFLGASPAHETRATKVQTYAHRTLLVWLGFEIWKDHPLLGVGFEGSAEPASFEPYLPAAHRRFPDEAPLAFPSRAPNRRYGVQNVWVQALADLGIVGLAALAALFAVGARTAARAALRADSPAGLVGLLWLALLVWLWTAQGFVAGIPLDALTWLAFGLAATSAAGTTAPETSPPLVPTRP